MKNELRYAIKNINKAGDFFMGSQEGEYVTDIWSCDIDTEFDDVYFFDEMEEAEKALSYILGYCPAAELVKVNITNNGYTVEEKQWLLD